MGKKFFCFLIAICLIWKSAISQSLLDSITELEIRNTISVLASDSFRGRGNGSPELVKAGLYIGDKFRQSGLLPLIGQPGYYIPFNLYKDNTLNFTDILEWNNKPVSIDRFMFIKPVPGNYSVKKAADFSVIHIDSCFSEKILKQYDTSSADLLIWTSQKQKDGENFFPEMITAPAGGIHHNFLLVYSDEPPDSLTLTGVSNLYSGIGYNVVGMLSGSSRKNEVIIFSAHYDHMGVQPPFNKDSIMNGANDNASGVAALLALADYFSLKGDNERTILFCAFAGEELGLLGSSDFIKYINHDKITAGINIEMIGVPRFGKNSIFITGKKYSSLPLMLKKNLEGKGVKVKREPDEKSRLFQRSDNFPFALLGVPAHTIMCGDDSDPCYHMPCDEFKRIDIAHMTQIIRAVAVATESLISGNETPTRVKAGGLR